MKRRGELNLIATAIRQGWDITDKGRSDALALVREVLDDSAATQRERLRACSVALLMEQRNMLDDDDAALLELVKRLGNQYQSAATGI